MVPTRIGAVDATRSDLIVGPNESDAVSARRDWRAGARCARWRLAVVGEDCLTTRAGSRCRDDRIRRWQKFVEQVGRNETAWPDDDLIENAGEVCRHRDQHEL